jgi:hypothetical protein
MFFLFGEKVLCFHFLANSMISSGSGGQFRNAGSSWLASHMLIPTNTGRYGDL